MRHGESVKVVQSRLGHASAADTYFHLWPDSEDRTRQAVDLVLGAPEDQLRTTGSSCGKLQISTVVTVSRPVGGVLL
jgi:hypothetical protein